MASFLFDVAGLKLFGHYAFGEYPRITSREALRCIANALLLLPETRDTFAELEFVSGVAEAYKFQDNIDEFLLARILFLMTYTKSTDLAGLIEEHDLASSIVTHIKRHADTPPLVLRTDIDAVAGVFETLKLLFNVTDALPQYSKLFGPAIPPLLAYLVRVPPPQPPLQGGVMYFVNALANLEFRDESSNKPLPGINTHLEPVVDRLLAVLEKGLEGCTEAQLDTQAIPLLTLFRRINDVADNGTRSRMKAKLLPKDSERDLPLGQSPTLASRLLRLTTSAGLVHLPEAVSSLLFELSDKDASAFVKNIGYGYAAGYLMSHRIPIPESAKATSSGEGQIPINPVTGQRLDKEEEVKLPEMSQDEKEREAERLFVLFERLRATGVVDVKNPVHQAMAEGRFEEVEDSDPDRG